MCNCYPEDVLLTQDIYVTLQSYRFVKQRGLLSLVYHNSLILTYASKIAFMQAQQIFMFILRALYCCLLFLWVVLLHFSTSEILLWFSAVFSKQKVMDYIMCCTFCIQNCDTVHRLNREEV